MQSELSKLAYAKETKLTLFMATAELLYKNFQGM